MKFGGNMLLKNHIEERVVALTDNPISIQKRVTLCLWDKSSGIFQGNVRYNSRKTDICIFDIQEKSFAELLKQQLEQQKSVYRNNIEKGLVSTSMELYVLIIISFENRKILDQMNEIINKLFCSMFSNCIIEYYVLTKEDTVREKIFEGNIGNKTYYLSDSFASVDVLLNNAEYDMILFSTFIRNNGFKNSHIFVLKIDECNAVREQLCYKSLCEIEKQISKKEDDRIYQEIKDYLFSNEWKEKILSEVPKIEWIPLIGINELVEKLPMKYPNYINRILVYLNKLENKSDNLSVQEAIGILYGSNGNEIRTESIRKSLKKGIILELCRSYLKTIDENIFNIIYQRFSVYDILYFLKTLLFKYKEEIIKQQVKDIEEKIKICLQAPFSSKNSSVESIFEGLKTYREAYNDFCDKYVEYCWWEVLIKYCDECKANAKQMYEEFIEARNILKNLLISPVTNITKNKMSFYEARNDWSIICLRDLEDRIDNFISDSSFSVNDLKLLIKLKDSLFVSQHDLHIDTKFHPFVIMLVSERSDIVETIVEELVKTREVSFSWKLFKATHISVKEAYQIRVYNLVNNEEDK